MKQLASLGSLLRNPYLWGGLLVLLLVTLIGYFLVDRWLMPAYTRHGVVQYVPDVRQLPYAQAAQILQAQGLRPERVPARRFRPDLPLETVLDQAPPPQAAVKPGRRIYLTINAGRNPMVTVPSVIGMSLREAVNRLAALGLRADDLRPDTIPSPYARTVTRQYPAPGDSVTEGSSVILWYSTGLGERFVTVPDVTGRTVAEAQRILLAHRLRSVVVEPRESTEAAGDTSRIVVRQSREPGTQVREGFEIRLFVAPPDTL
ncbi:PASTA domain-containing protein [Rhodothermus profundi]|uniref:PASTA domain-containing protein n=1 Tax=Rhodothermus profundi TaxID=633813 RepID=A0A1M6TWQ3_9BACT|nr:PASTA domain-containing protein [Rhodothermus profundi]SHK61320.1 PASTA domain-containing protein [Rhodothermus profundi]